MSTSKNGKICTGLRFKATLIAGISWFAQFKDEVNRINVFPVPDADTGDNIHNTFGMMQSELRKSDWRRVSSVAQAASQGALMGARGCSGTIMAGFFNGFSQGVSKKDTLTASEIADSLMLAAEFAFRTVTKPKEGTILTVARDAARAAQEAAKDDNANLLEVLEFLLREAKKSLLMTTQTLEVLRQANVVDAGAQGLVYFFEGMARYNAGQELKVLSPGLAKENPKLQLVQVPIKLRYCADFILKTRDLTADSAREILSGLGEEIIINDLNSPDSDYHIIKVHLHTHVPEMVFDALGQYGRMMNIKVDDMNQALQK